MTFASSLAGTYPGTGPWTPAAADYGNVYAPGTKAFPMDAIVSESPAQITLRIFSSPTPGSTYYNTNISGNYDIYRKDPLAPSWAKVGSVTVGTAITTWTDSNVVVGQLYEYGAKKVPNDNSTWMYGFIIAGIKADQTQPKGRIAIVVANDIPGRLPVEYAQYKADLIADGWVVNEISCNRAKDYTSNGSGANDAMGLPTAPYATDHITIRNQIISLYQDSANQYPGLPLREVVLLGKVPVPRAGLQNIAPDGHENQAAMGADAYYADMDGVWADTKSNEAFLVSGTAVTGFVNNADNTVTLPPSALPVQSYYTDQVVTARVNTAPGGSNAGGTVTVSGYPYTFVVTNGQLVSMASAYADAGLVVSEGSVNVPGDNKWDAEYMSDITTPNSTLEIGFGRIDFSNSVPDEYESMRNYFNKDHRYKTASPDFLPGRRAVQRPGFGMVNIAYLEGMPSVLGMGNCDFVRSSSLPADPYDSDAAYTATHPCLFYFKGDGGPDHSDGSKAVFWTGMQSHWGYWFHNVVTSGQNAMQLRLAEDNWTLSYTWSIGLYALDTSYLYHRMGMGFDAGDMMRVSMSDRKGPTSPYTTYLNPAQGADPLFMQHMGDPSIRLFMFPPPKALSIVKTSGNPVLTWQAGLPPVATEPQVIGYHVYRAPTVDGPYIRITSTPVAATTYTDTTVSSGQYAYMVRGVRLETTGGGSFYNASLGTVQSVDLSNPPTALQIATTALPDTNWNTPYTFNFAGQGGTPNYSWTIVSGSLPSGLTLDPSGQLSGVTSRAGSYAFTVQATDAGGQIAQKLLTLNTLSNDTHIFYPEAGQLVSPSKGIGGGYLYYLSVSGPTYSYNTYLRFNISTLNPNQRVASARLLLNGSSPTNTADSIIAALTLDAGDTFTDTSLTYATRPLDNPAVPPVTAATFPSPYTVMTLDATSFVKTTLASDAARKVGIHLYSGTANSFANEARFSNRFAPLTSRPRLVIETTNAPAINITSPLGSPAFIYVGSNLLINATVTPVSPNVAVTLWTQVSGPGTTTFGTPNAPSTTAVFSAPGDYVLRLSADDGVLQSSQDLPVRVVSSPVKGPASGMVLRLGLDESSGTVAADSANVSPANNGTLSGNPVWAPAGGRIGGALTFDGTGDRVTVADSTTNLLDGGSQFSLSMWVYPVDTAAHALAVKRTSGGVNESYTFSLLSGSKPQIDIGKYVAASTNRLSSGTALSSNAWHHLVVVFDGTLAATDKRIKLYIDGSADNFKATTVSTVPRNTTAPLMIGGYDTAGSAFNGSMDEVRVYNRALTNSEILELSQATPSNLGPVVTLGSPNIAGNAGQPFNLSATVTDDNLPSPLTLAWLKTSGPGSLVFGSPASASTTGTANLGGNYFIRFLATDGDITTWADVAAVISGGQTYASWAAGFGLTGADADPNASPAHDGIANLLKYAFGFDPTQNYGPGTLGLPRTQIVSNYLTLSFTGVTPGLTYTVEATSDLKGAWSSLYTFSGPGAPGAVTVTDTQATSTLPQRYMRLRVTEP